MPTQTTAIHDVESWNDAFARENDIDQYYSASSPLIRWIEGRRLAAIRRLTQAQPRHRILEVGCGGGHVLRMFPQCELVGVDVSGEMLRKAQRNLAGYRATLHKGQLEELNLPAASFDRIICTEVLEHVVDPESVLQQMARLLHSQGRVVVTFPNDSLVNSLKTLIRRSGLTFLPPLRRISWGGDHYHLHQWTVTEMRDLLGRWFTVRRQSLQPTRILPIRCCFQCGPKR